MESGAKVRNTQKASSAQSSWMKKTSGSAATSGQDYEVALCCLLFLRALRLSADFLLATNVAPADKFDDVVLFYRLKKDTGLKYRAILLLAKHKNKNLVKVFPWISPYELNDYLKSFKKIKNLWEQSVKVENREIELQEISLVLYKNTGCVVGVGGLDVTDYPEMQHLQEFLNTGGILIRITEAQRVGLPEGQETSEFLGHLLLCTQQMSVKTADHFLEQELCKTLKLTSLEDARKLNSVLKRVMKKWWSEEGTVRYLTAQSQEWIKVLQTMVTHLNSDTLIVDSELNLNYTEDVLKAFDVDPRLTNICWISVKDKYQAKTVRSRFFRAHRNSVVVGVKYLESHLEEVEALWGKTVCPTLALDLSDGSQKEGSLLLQRLKEAVQKDACKVLFIINMEKPETDGWIVVEAVATWSILDQATRENLLKVQVELQGKLVTLIDVCSDVSDVMSDEIIYSLSVRKNAIKLGEPTPSPLEFYVPCCLQRISCNRINFGTLQNKNTLLFAKTGMFYPWDIKYLSESDLMRLDKIRGPIRVVGINLESAIRNLCSRFRVRGLFGDTDSKGFKSNVTEIIPFTWICEEKVVVIEGVPGVGKSSFVTAMCSSVKQQFPEAWVLRIDMGRHSDYIKEKDFRSGSDIKEFLLKGLSKDLHKLEKDLLEHSLYVTGNVFLFVDAFDEISPDYTTKGCDLLKGIVQKFRFRQMVVTTRPVTTKDVQMALETEAFTLPVFSEKEQTLILNWQDSKGRTPLHKASRHGHMEAVRLLIDKKADPNILSKDGSTALMLAVEKGHLDVVKLLIKNGANLNVKTMYGVTALMMAVGKGHLDLIKLLIEKGASPNIHTKYGSSALILAVEKGHLNVIKLLIENGADLNFVTQYGINFQTKNADTALMMAARKDHLEVVKLLLDNGADLNFLRYYSETALMIGARLGHLEVVNLLIENGADLNFGETALIIGARKGHLKVVKLLLDNGADLNIQMKNGQIALTMAARLGHLEVVKLLIENVPDVNIKLENGQTALVMTADQGHLEVVKLLIENGADINFQTKNADTALMMAARKGHLEVVKLLIENGADLNLQAEYGQTALMMATGLGHLEVVNLLTDNGADLNINDEDGNTALMVAVLYGHLELVKLLIEGGAEPNMNNDEGETALWVAARLNSVTIVEYLLTNGADCNITNAKGKTFFEIFSEEVLAIMSKHGVYFPVDDHGG